MRSWDYLSRVIERARASRARVRPARSPPRNAQRPTEANSGQERQGTKAGLSAHARSRVDHVVLAAVGVSAALASPHSLRAQHASALQLPPERPMASAGGPRRRARHADVAIAGLLDVFAALPGTLSLARGACTRPSWRAGLENESLRKSTRSAAAEHTSHLTDSMPCNSSASAVGLPEERQRAKRARPGNDRSCIAQRGAHSGPRRSCPGAAAGWRQAASAGSSRRCSDTSRCQLSVRSGRPARCADRRAARRWRARGRPRHSCGRARR